MQCFLLQPWITLRGTSSLTTFTQGAENWLDLSAYQDLVFWLDAKLVNAGGGTSVSMGYETSVNREDADFAAMVSGGVTMSTSGPAVTAVLRDTASNAVARWVRWKITVNGTVTTTWDTTFRIWVATNVPPRMHAAVAAGSTIAATPQPLSPAGGLTSRSGSKGGSSGGNFIPTGGGLRGGGFVGGPPAPASSADSRFRPPSPSSFGNKFTPGSTPLK